MPTSPAERYIIRMSNSGVNPLNFAQFGIELLGGSLVPVPQVVAQLCAYVVSVGAGAIAEDTFIDRVTYQEAGTDGYLPQPFPTTEWAALVAANPDLGAATAYSGIVVGTGGLAPLGTSIVVTEYSATGGPSGRGRHFIPFVNTTCLDTATGFLNAANIAAIGVSYATYISPSGVDGASFLDPVVVPESGGTEKAVVTVVVQPVLSNLRSRRR